MLGPVLGRPLAALIAVVALLLGAHPAGAHDPSAFGGLFRSRNLGVTWLNADTGLFLNAALTVAVDPRDPNHLLMGTDVGMYASSNGGRSWTAEAQGLIVGAVFAIAFASDGRNALCAAPGGVFRMQDGGWTAVRAPFDAVPARAIVYAHEPGRIYLLGRERLFISEDGGASFRGGFEHLPDTARMTSLAVAPGPHEILLAVVDGRAVASEDAGRTWQPRRLDPGGDTVVDTVVADPEVAGRFWAAMHDRIYRSDDFGRVWRAIAARLPEADTNVRGIAADAAGSVLVVTTHRGMYRSDDGGARWGFMESRLPVHLESGPLVRDPTDAKTLYAVYSLMPYPEVWRTAVQGSNLLSQLDIVSVAGVIAFVLLVFMAGGLLVYWLVRLRTKAPTGEWPAARSPYAPAAPPPPYAATPSRPRP